MKKLFAFLGVFALTVAFNFPSAALAVSNISQIQAGELIRGQSFPAVYYYGRDGFRYVFPNDKTYFTWYNNFDGVKWLSDADLATIQIGGNVTYRPGIKMIKINSDPKTYAIGESGTLHWVSTEAAAIALYGSNWNTKIDDVPDSFFSNYKSGSHIESSADFSPSEETAAAISINEDKGLLAPIVVTISDNVYDQTSVTFQTGRAVKFINNGTNKHSATANDLTWGTGTLLHGQNFTRYFKQAGTYSFFDSYYPGSMTGSLIVE